MENEFDYVVTFTKRVSVTAESEEEAIEKATKTAYGNLGQMCFDTAECEFDIGKALRDMFGNTNSETLF